jgi:GNAT superfamily N-acetyltransferase
MIITGEDVVSKEPVARERDLGRITELVRTVDPEAGQLEIGHLCAINASGMAAFYCVDETIVGCARLLIYPRLTGAYVGILDALIVDPRFRHRGIATALIEHRVAYAKKRGLSRVTASTLPDNPAIHELYRKLGYEEFARIRFRLEF